MRRTPRSPFGIELRGQKLVLAPFSTTRMGWALRDRARLAQDLRARVPPSWPNEEFRGVLPWLAERWMDLPDEAHWTFLVVRSPERCVIGEIGAKGVPAGGQIEIGYGLVPEARGLGFGTDVVRTFSDWALRRRGVDRIVAECLQTNLGSVRVLEKAGFVRTREGTDAEGPTWWWQRERSTGS